MKYILSGLDEIQLNCQPKFRSKKEISTWKSFLNKVLPWITKKWELGNAYLETKVIKEASEVNRIEAEKEMQEVFVSYKDKFNALDISVEPFTERQIEDEIADLLVKIKDNYVKYGLKISFSVDYKESSSTIPAKKHKGRTRMDPAGNSGETRELNSNP